MNRFVAAPAMVMSAALIVCGAAVPATGVGLKTPVPHAQPAKKAAKGSLAITVTGTGTYTITGKGVSKTGQTSQTLRLKVGSYQISATGGTATPATVTVRRGKPARVSVSFDSNSNQGGSRGGIQAGEYHCHGAGTMTTLWIDSASTYRSPSGTPGTYRLDTATTPLTKGGIKVDWLTGTYADWQKESPPFWVEYLPVGAVQENNAVVTVATMLMTFDPKYTGVWTTCTRS